MIRNNRNAGFTLIELMIVVAIIAIIAAVAIPKLMSARIAANENAAIATLRSIAAAEQQFQSSVAIDTDGDGGGEYGFLAELAGVAMLRDFDPTAADGDGCIVGVDMLEPPFLATAFGDIANAAGGGSGVVERQGYYFRIFLPDRNAAGFFEAGAGTGMVAGDAGGNWSPDNCEIYWCAYAWPVNAERTGTRSFFINQEGDITQTANTTTIGQFSGQAAMPAWSDAYQDTGDMESPTAMAAMGILAPMARIWTPVGN